MTGTLAEMPLYTGRTVNSSAEINAEAGATVHRARTAQREWAAIPLDERIRILKRVRHSIAEHSLELAMSIPDAQPSSLHRNTADTLVAEVLPLAEACRFLTRQAAAILRPRRLRRTGRPFWLRGLQSEVHRVPFGVVLLIAPSNYPLFLPGVQALQALVSGNAVLWKPAIGGEVSARALARVCTGAGLPSGVLQVLESSVDQGIAAIRAGVDKVFLTGHADTGRAVMRELAETLTPSVMELSGCDAVFVLPGADLARTARALAFGMRLNGSATCMAPRRIFADPGILDDLLPQLLHAVESLPEVQLPTSVSRKLDSLLRDAAAGGAIIVRDGRGTGGVTPTIVRFALPEQAIMQTDIFAPVLSLCATRSPAHALSAHEQCPYALTAAVFGPEKEAVEFAARIHAGTVLTNDLIVSTADPRVPFGGRGASGFGVTRGREGLLEMTAVKTILRQTSRSLRPFARTGDKHVRFFSSFIEAMHAGSLSKRIRGLRQLVTAARNLEK